MEFLKSITLKEIREVCFEESVNLLCEKEIIGSWCISLKEGKPHGTFEFKSNFKVKIDKNQGGTEIEAIISGNLVTEEQKKYEYNKVGTLKEWHSYLYRQDDGSYINHWKEAQKNKSVIKKECMLQKEEMECFISEAAGLILQRIIALRRCNDIIILTTLNQNCRLCDVSYTPLGIEIIRVHKIEFKVFAIQGDIHHGKNKRLLWKTCYHPDGFLMFYNQDGCPLYSNIPKQPGRGESKIYTDLREKHGLKYLQSVEKEDIVKLLFAETCETHFGDRSGVFHAVAKLSHFQDESCVLVQIHRSSPIKDGCILSTITSYFNFDFETLYYIQHDIKQKHNKQIQKIWIICQEEERDEENSYHLTKILINGKETTKSKIRYHQDDFVGFLSKASSFLLQRLLTQRKIDRNIEFLTVCDNLKIAKLIFRPLVEDIPDNVTFALECSSISQFGEITVSRNYFSSDGHLLFSFEYGSPIKIEYKLLDLLPKIEVDQDFTNIFNSIQPFENASQFVDCIELQDLIQILFDEKLRILGDDGSDYGTVLITVEDHLFSAEKHILVHCKTSLLHGNESCTTTITGKLSAHLDTLEQFYEEVILDCDHVLQHKKITIKKGFSQYVAHQIVKQGVEVKEQEKIIDFETSLPFMSQAASILLERLIVQKRVKQSLQFSAVDSKLENCLVKYIIMPKQFWSIQGKKCEVICLERDIYLTAKHFKRKWPHSKWKLCFYPTGYYVEHIQDHEHLKIVASVYDSDSFQMLSYLVAHDEVGFDRTLHFSEIPSLLFDDHLAAITKTKDELGAYTASVDHIKYDGIDALLVQVILLGSFENDISGSVIVGYINFNLEIIDYYQFNFLQKMEL